MKNFAPFIQISPDPNTAAGERIAIMFASLLADDETASSRVVFVPRSVADFSWDIQLVEGTSMRPAILVKLLVTDADGEKQEHHLALITCSSVSAAEVRRGIAATFRVALAEYLQWVARSSDLSRSDTPRAWSAPAVTDERSESTGRSGWSRAASVAGLVCVGVVCAVVLIAGVGVLFSKSGIFGWPAGQVEQSRTLARVEQSSDAIRLPVSPGMAEDPASIRAQVELTEQTLRQMGIDPGRPGDLGCLAPQ